ncbi:CPBP family intramembrane glutamic endopeptidase [Vibrio cholerae]|uniref:CPBP family intramembrane glutamic endopeptidase n=1 Tax=Vibrio cholerae TaxID=666 RepID=UPI00053C6AE1|nr:CPBP family intramembrane glutamic endopeptidase [Vibrio cholerae]
MNNFGTGAKSTSDVFLLLLFLFITFSISWFIIGSYIFFPVSMRHYFGDINGAHPLFFLATWAPAIAAFIVIFVYRGFSGIYAFLSRLLLWRCSIYSWLVILLVLPLVFIFGSLIKGGGIITNVEPHGWSSLVVLLFMMLFLGPVEEFGWRGFAQPILQRYLTPLSTGLLIGFLWGVWHLPAFYLAGTVFADWQFLPFFIGNITLAVLVTPLFNASKGSLLLPMMFHWQLINPFWPDAQPWDTWLLVVITFIIFLFGKHFFLDHSSAVKRVLPETASVSDL